MTKLHTDLLIALRAAGQFGLGVNELLTDLRQGRHRALTLPELEKALRDLADRAFAIAFTSPLGATRWSATAVGGRALQEEGL